MPEIRHLLHITASASVVYRALTEQSGLQAWWTGETIASPQVGSIAEFSFGERYHNKMRITRLDQDRRVEWQCLDGDREWVGTTFLFDLDASEGRTTVRFTHGNWRESTDFLASCNYHWGYYLRSLKTYCETGLGTPFQEDT